MIDFSLPDELQELQDRTRAFIRDKIIPMEGDLRQSAHGPSDELRLEVAALGREADLLTPHIGTEWGGLGLNHIGKGFCCFGLGAAQRRLGHRLGLRAIG